MKYLIGIIVALTIITGCKNGDSSDLCDSTMDPKDFGISSKQWISLLDTTIDGIRYHIVSPNDSINNTLFFFYDKNKLFQLDAKRFGFQNGVSKCHFEYPTKISVYDSNIKDFKDETLIIRPNYYMFALSDNGGMFENICILFKDNKEVQKCYILPDHHSKLVNFSDSSDNMVWCSYYDINKEILVIEERIASYNTGPYLVSAYKIEKDTIIMIGESINNHENYTYFKGENNIFERMLKNNAKNIIPLKH
jgi:hypothetical protein